MTCTAPEQELLGFAAAGTLDPGDAERVRVHAEACPDCGPELRDLRELTSELRALHLTADEVVDTAWGGAEPAHVRECARCRAEVELVRRSAAELQPRASAWRLPPGLAAAAGVAAVLLTGWNVMLHRENRELARSREEAVAEATRAREDGARQVVEGREAARRAAEAAAAPAVNVPIVDLEPAPTRGTAIAPARVRLDPEATWVTLVLATRGPAAERPHALVLREAGGREVWQGRGLRATPYDTFVVALPARLLSAGRYELELSAEGGPAAGRYALQVVR